KLLFLTSRFPFPLEKGDKLRAYYFIKHLSAHHEIYLFAINEQMPDTKHLDELRPYCKAIEVVKISKLQSLFNLAKNIFNRSIPFQTAYFTSTLGKKKLNEFITQHKPDALFCHLIRMGEYTKGLSIDNSMLDFMDTFSIGMKRFAESGNWLTSIPASIEYNRLLRYEHQMFDAFKNKIIISKQDQSFIPHQHKEAIKVIPNGVDSTFYTKSIIDKKYDLLFIGNLSYAPNIYAIKYAAEYIMPQLPQLNLAVVGATPSSEITKLQSPNIHIIGWVDDSRDAFNQSKIMIAPMFISIGLQNKILQAMSMEIPCVITSMANNALGAIPEKEVLIADTPEEFSKQILRLLNEEELHQKIVGNARDFILKNYNWTENTEKINLLLMNHSSD
ncbi:MAG: glycosyltransferase, partial [Bacteroidota bacterium]